MPGSRLRSEIDIRRGDRTGLVGEDGGLLEVRTG